MLVLDFSGLKPGPAGASLTPACVTCMHVSVGLAGRLGMGWRVLLCQHLHRLRVLLAPACLHLIAATTVLDLHSSNRLNCVWDQYVLGKMKVV